MKKVDLFEGVDYELVPFDGDENQWAVRMLTGPFPETVIIYNTVAFNEIEEHISFNFGVVSSPDEDLVPENTDLQNYCGLLLEALIEDKFHEGLVEFEDKE